MLEKLSDSYLLSLFREAAKVHYGNKCIFCGKSKNIQIHHIVPCSNEILRWDWRNGIPVCGIVWGEQSCHEVAHTEQGRQKIIEIISYEWYTSLKELQRKSFKDHLLTIGQTRIEFQHSTRDDLKNKIKMKGGQKL